MLRMLGQSEYGLFGTANSFIGYLSILSFGIGGAYIRFNAQARAAHDEVGERKLNGMFLTIYSVLSLLVLIGGIIFIYCVGFIVKDTFTPQELLELRLIMFNLTLNTIVSFVFNVVMMALQAYERFICIRVCLLLAGIMTPVANIIVMMSGGKAVALSTVSLIISTLMYVFFFFYARFKINMKFVFRGFNKSLMREVFIFSGFLFLNSVTDQLTFSTDNIVLGAVGGTAVVAVYSIGANFKGYFMNFSSSISSVFAPQVNRIVATNGEQKELDNIFIKIGRIQFLVVSLILIGYVCIGQDFISIWAGPDYKDAFWIGLLLMVAIFVPCFQNVGIEIQKAKNMHKARSIIYLVVAIVNVGLTIPFSMMFGGIGAALATTICMFMGTVVFMNFYYYKYVNLDIKRFWISIAKMLPGMIPVCIVGGIINQMYVLDSYLKILIAAIVIMLIYCLSVWFLSLNSYEKDMFSKPVKKLINKFKRG